MTDVDDRPSSRPRSKRRIIWISVAGVLVVGLVIGLALFQPWKIFTRSTVDEAAPVAAAPVAATTQMASTATDNAGSGAGPAAGSTAVERPSAAATAAAAPPSVTSEAAPPPPAQPEVLATGTFVDGEHSTTGSASVLQLPDGSRYVRLEGFSTSDGPDVQVWVTDQQAGGDDWGKYDDGRYVELGTLKGTDGNQNYLVPADADLSGLTSVVIWCDRFNVAFGSAAVDL